MGDVEWQILHRVVEIADIALRENITNDILQPLVAVFENVFPDALPIPDVEAVVRV